MGKKDVVVIEMPASFGCESTVVIDANNRNEVVGAFADVLDLLHDGDIRDFIGDSIVVRVSTRTKEQMDALREFDGC